MKKIFELGIAANLGLLVMSLALRSLVAAIIAIVMVYASSHALFEEGMT